MKKEHEWDKRRGPHVCRPLVASTVRQIHWILSGAMERAVVAEEVDQGSLARHRAQPVPVPDPDPLDAVGRDEGAPPHVLIIASTAATA